MSAREARLAAIAAGLANDMETMVLTMEAIALVVADKIVNQGYTENGIDLCCDGIRELALHHCEPLRAFNASPEGKAALDKFHAKNQESN